MYGLGHLFQYGIVKDFLDAVAGTGAHSLPRKVKVQIWERIGGLRRHRLFSEVAKNLFRFDLTRSPSSTMRTCMD